MKTIKGVIRRLIKFFGQVYAVKLFFIKHPLDYLKLSQKERCLFFEPWYNDFSVLGVKTFQKNKKYELNQKAKQEILFPMILKMLALCKKTGPGSARGVELFSANSFYGNFAVINGADKVTAVDTDPYELSKGKLITKLLGNENKMDFQSINVFDLKESYDFAICAGGLYHISDPAGLLKILKDKVKVAMVIQTIISLENTSPDYFVTPAPNWTWGCRFSYDYLLNMVREAGWEIIEATQNEMGNKRLESKASGYVLCRPKQV
ncbi:MAG: methyltransferase domain-containing protein [Candidatus Komeilibacteria bacterium]|nr:methyltransferase domain-containing protein [Candidatus Komeilibacteria bacterium]